MEYPIFQTSTGDIFTLGYDSLPSEGFEFTVNEKTGGKYPDCCETHKKLRSDLEDWFNLFPNCCDYHKKMIGKWWFKKENYNGVVTKILNVLVYTEHHIQKMIDKKEWYIEITDFIENINFSFGVPSIGFDLYKLYLIRYIRDTELVKDVDKKQLLINYFESLENIKKDKYEIAESTDLNVLIDTYNRWYKIFPFELSSYFGNLKEHFKSKLPILKESPVLNKYSGLSKAQLHTKSSLIEALINLTKDLLYKINGLAMFEGNLISDANKISLELVVNNRRLQLEEGYESNSQNEEQRYRKILKKWFNDEKQFFKEIAPLLKSSEPKAETKNEKLRLAIEKYGFFKIPKVDILSDESKEKLFQLLIVNDLPYKIAMFAYLEYLSYLAKEHFGTKAKLNIEISKWLGSDKEGRTVKGNISTLSPYSKENKNKYTSHLHKENVERDYQNIK